MLRVISYKVCPFVQRVTALLAAGNIPFEVEYISLRDKPRWFLEVSPTGQVPVLITAGGETLFESDAIVEYIDEVHRPLEAGISAEQRALDRAWSYQGAKHYLVQCSAMSSRDRQTLEARRERLDRAFARVEQQLGQGPFFKGGNISQVDIAWLPLLHRAALVTRERGFDFLANFPRVKAWQSALLELDIATRSVSADFDEVFRRAYLSESTFLGAGRDVTETDTAGCGG